MRPSTLIDCRMQAESEHIRQTQSTAKRLDFGGFTIHALGYRLELVTVRHLPAVLALSKGTRTIWRIER
jgi:hypothetical protein